MHSHQLSKPYKAQVYAIIEPMRNKAHVPAVLHVGSNHAKRLDRRGVTHLALHLVLQPCQSHLPSGRVLLGRQLLDIIY